jgi:hypothetical protein
MFIAIESKPRGRNQEKESEGGFCEEFALSKPKSSQWG